MIVKNKEKLFKAFSTGKSFRNNVESVLFSIEKFDDFFDFFSFIEGEIRIFKNGIPVESNLYVEPKIKGKYCNRYIKTDAVKMHLNDGATIIFEALNEKNSFSHSIAKCFENIFQNRTWVNAYLTPKKSFGFDYHSDDHNVLILQILGSKKWFLKNLDNKVQEFIITPNEYLFIPKGMVHRALSEDEFSFHLTIGINDEENIDTDYNLGLLNSLFTADNINNETVFEIVKLLNINKTSDGITLKLGAKEITFPNWTQSFITEIESSKTFSISNSISILDNDSKKKILTTLYKNKLIKTVPTQSASLYKS